MMEGGGAESGAIPAPTLAEPDDYDPMLDLQGVEQPVENLGVVGIGLNKHNTSFNNSENDSTKAIDGQDSPTNPLDSLNDGMGDLISMDKPPFDGAKGEQMIELKDLSKPSEDLGPSQAQVECAKIREERKEEY